MGKAKDIILRPISAQDANALVKRVHYSGKVVQNSQLHIGVFYHGKLEGAMQFGPSLDKRKIQGLVEGTGWHEFIELNRMAFTDVLPRNSESRALSIAFKLLRKHAPQLKWVVTFADGAQCGDGTIYRAAGFVLTGLSTASMIELPDDLAAINGGKYAHRMTLQAKSNRMYKVMQERLSLNGAYKQMEWYAEKLGTKVVEGFQIRYIYFLDPTYRDRLTVPVLPYSAIDEAGAGMYKGQSCARSVDSGTLDQPVEKRRCNSDPGAPNLS